MKIYEIFRRKGIKKRWKKEEERAALQAFYEKHREQIDNADALPQPIRTIAEFVKKEIERGGT
jgi:hypothetical protein